MAFPLQKLYTTELAIYSFGRFSWASVFDLACPLCHVCRVFVTRGEFWQCMCNRRTRHSPMTQRASQARDVEEVDAQPLLHRPTFLLRQLRANSGRRRRRGWRRRRGTTPTLVCLVFMAIMLARFAEEVISRPPTARSLVRFDRTGCSARLVLCATCVVCSLQEASFGNAGVTDAHATLL